MSWKTLGLIVLVFSLYSSKDVDACSKRGSKPLRGVETSEALSLMRDDQESVVSKTLKENRELARIREDYDRARSSMPTNQAMVGYSIYLTAQILNHIYPTDVASQLMTQFNAILTADFITGMFHWLEDTYGGMGTEPQYASGIGSFVGQILQENRTHHSHPSEMLKSTPYELVRDPAIAATVVGVLLLPFLSYQDYPYVASVLGWSAAGNLVHSWAHMQKSNLPWGVANLQGCLFQTRSQHQIHHRATDRNYCVMTDFLNPVLESLGFWQGIEWIIEKSTGVAPRLHELESDSPAAGVGYLAKGDSKEQ